MASRIGLIGAAKRWASQRVERSHRKLKRLLISGLIALLLLGCANRSGSVRLIELPEVPKAIEEKRLNGSISEVAPPAIFSDLDELIADVRPQVAIASPKPDQTLEATTLTPKITLRGLSIYKDETLNLGPHLQIILDNQPAQSIYSLDEPVDLSALAPGSHTLRVLAVKPWGESFKNEEAYAQTTFHVFAKTNENTPEADRPQLIYSQPQGSYGAQPVLLDFALNNAPLHAIAKSDPDIADWRIRCDVNGQSFVFDRWQPIYLKGFKPGQNWVQLTLIDEQGSPIENEFNNTVRLIHYDLELRDTLAKLTRGELSLRDVGQIVDPNYEPPIEVVEPVDIEPVDIEPDVESDFETRPETPESEEAVESREKEVLRPVEDLPEALENTVEESKNFLEKSAIEAEAAEDIEVPSSEEVSGKKSEVDAEIDSGEPLEPVDSPIEDGLSIEDDDLSTTEDLSIDTLSIEDNLEGEADLETDTTSAPDSPGFLSKIQTFWRSLNTPEPAPANNANTTIPSPLADNFSTDNFLIDSPLVIPELQLLDLYELGSEVPLPEVLTTPEAPTEVAEPTLEPAD